MNEATLEGQQVNYFPLQKEGGSEKSPFSKEKFRIEETTIISKLSKRIQQNKTPYIIFSDMDGTLYIKRRRPDGSWIKEGDNKKFQAQLEEKGIPLVIVSGRPDWGNGDKEMETYGLKPPDVVIVGAGSLIYWRTPDGKLEIDEEFLEMMKNQSVTIRHKDKTWQTFNYGEGINTLREYLDSSLGDFKGEDQGVTQVKIDTNKGTGFVTLDLTNISFDKLRRLRDKIRQEIQGVRVEFSEDIEKVSEENFSGWMQIIPASGGKDKAIKYVLGRIADVINSSNEEAKKPHALCFGDSAIDISMLAMGVNTNDRWKITQYPTAEASPYGEQAGHTTPYASERLGRVYYNLLHRASSLPPSFLGKLKRANMEIIPEGIGYPAGLEIIINNLD